MAKKRQIIRSDGKQYSSIADAARALKADGHFKYSSIKGMGASICRACSCKDVERIAFGYKWRYADEVQSQQI